MFLTTVTALAAAADANQRTNATACCESVLQKKKGWVHNISYLMMRHTHKIKQFMHSQHRLMMSFKLFLEDEDEDERKDETIRWTFCIFAFDDSFVRHLIIAIDHKSLHEFQLCADAREVCLHAAIMLNQHIGARRTFDVFERILFQTFLTTFHRIILAHFHRSPFIVCVTEWIHQIYFWLSTMRAKWIATEEKRGKEGGWECETNGDSPRFKRRHPIWRTKQTYFLCPKFLVSLSPLVTIRNYNENETKSNLLIDAVDRFGHSCTTIVIVTNENLRAINKQSFFARISTIWFVDWFQATAKEK